MNYYFVIFLKTTYKWLVKYALIQFCGLKTVCSKHVCTLKNVEIF